MIEEYDYLWTSWPEEGSITVREKSGGGEDVAGGRHLTWGVGRGITIVGKENYLEDENYLYNKDER